jgi:urease accessory protein
MQSQLAVARVAGRSVVTRARATAPLRLLAPASPGDAAWVYQASLGGGFVGRDAIDLRVDVAPGARLLLTSQASSKVYRGAASRCRLDAHVGAGGVLIAWPDPIACFADADFAQDQRIALAGDAAAIAVDAWTAGRVGHGERWAFARLALTTELSRDGAPVIREAVELAAAHGPLAPRLAADAYATVVICGFDAAAIVARVAALPVAHQPWVAASAWPWGAVLRLAAGSAERLHHALLELLGPLVRAALGADPFARKW